MRSSHRGAKMRPVLLAAPIGRRARLAMIAGAMVVAAAASLQDARAGSSTDGAGALSINQALNFTMVYPRFLRFRVGSAGSGVIDRVTFSPTVGNLGSATALTGVGGDAGGSTANVEVVGNNGQVTITPTNNSGGLGLGTGSAADGYISYGQIETLTSDAALPAPVLSDAGGTASQPALNNAMVTARSAQWTYRYLNATVPSAGTYGAGGGTGGRVTYTATMP
jgi:hypothetical protein